MVSDASQQEFLLPKGGKRPGGGGISKIILKNFACRRSGCWLNCPRALQAKICVFGFQINGFLCDTDTISHAIPVYLISGVVFAFSW
jgi:hypothetical protein